MSLLPLTGLADPQFVERDPQKIVEEMITQYETVTGRTLYPAQVERLVIDLVAYRESMTREGTPRQKTVAVEFGSGASG